MKPKLELPFHVHFAKWKLTTTTPRPQDCLASDPTACCWRSTALLISAQCCPRNGRPKCAGRSGRAGAKWEATLFSCLAPDDKLHPLRRDLQIGSFFLGLDSQPRFLFPPPKQPTRSSRISLPPTAKMAATSRGCLSRIRLPRPRVRHLAAVGCPARLANPSPSRAVVSQLTSPGPARPS